MTAFSFKEPSIAGRLAEKSAQSPRGFESGALLAARRLRASSFLLYLQLGT
jgi:hypothetical protein